MTGQDHAVSSGFMPGHYCSRPAGRRSEVSRITSRMLVRRAGPDLRRSGWVRPVRSARPVSVSLLRLELIAPRFPSPTQRGGRSAQEANAGGIAVAAVGLARRDGKAFGDRAVCGRSGPDRAMRAHLSAGRDARRQWAGMAPRPAPDVRPTTGGQDAPPRRRPRTGGGSGRRRDAAWAACEAGKAGRRRWAAGCRPA